MLEDLIVFSEAEWVDLQNSRKRAYTMLSRDAVQYLGIEPTTDAADCQVTLSCGSEQVAIIESPNNRVPRDKAYYMATVDLVNPRRNLRYAVFQPTPRGKAAAAGWALSTQTLFLSVSSPFCRQACPNPTRYID